MVGRLAPLALALALVASACGEDGRPPPPASKGAVFALLDDHRLVKMSIPDGRVLATEAIRAEPRRDFGPGHYLALSRDAKTLFVLVRGARDSVAVVEASSLRVRARYRLEPGVEFQALALGPRSGRIYVFGNRPGRETKSLREFGSREASVVIASLDGTTGRPLFVETVRPAGGFDWWVYSAAVSPDERRLFVTYHGCCTSGVDWFEMSPRGLERCRKTSRYRGNGCAWQAHGHVDTYENSIIAATGSPTVVEVDGSGRTRQRWNTRLRGNHVMEFALDRDRGRLYAVGGCRYVPGFSAVDLVTRRVRLLQRPEKTEVCGERLAVGLGSLVVVATNGPLAVLFLDGRTGRLIREVKTRAEPIDVVVSPR